MALATFKLRCNDPFKKLFGALKSLFDQVELVYRPENVLICQNYEATSSSRKNRKREVASTVEANMLVQLVLPKDGIELNYHHDQPEFSQVFNVMDLYEVYRSTGVKNGSRLTVPNPESLQMVFYDIARGAEYYNGQVNTVPIIRQLYMDPEGLDSFTRACTVDVDRLIDVVKSITNMIKLITSTNTAWYQWGENGGVYFYVLDNNSALKGYQVIGTGDKEFKVREERQRVPRSLITFIRTCLTTAEKKSQVELARGAGNELLMTVKLRMGVGHVNIVVH